MSDPSVPIGNRAKLLGELLSAKLPVPAGFVVSSHAFEEFVAHNLLRPKIRDLLKDVVPTDTKAIQIASRQIKKLILSGQFPSFVVQQVLRMYLKIGEGRVMLYPSLFLGEGDNPLFAHWQEVYFGYEGDANLFTGIREVWSHFFDPKPLFYRIKHGRDHFDLPFAISVQEQPKFKATGVLHTSDPTSKDKQAISIKAVWGEGGLTHELDSCDHYWVSKPAGVELKSVYDKQARELIWQHGEVFWSKIPETRRGKHKLSSLQTKALAKMAQKITQRLFFPHEVIFGVNDASLWIVDLKPMELHGHQRVPERISSAAPALVPPIQKSKLQKSHTRRAVGLIHDLTSAGHLPSVQTIGGSYLINPHLLLTSLKEGKLHNFNVISHELVQRLLFLLTRAHPEKGFLYSLEANEPSSPDYTAQVHALLTLRHKLSSTPLSIVVRGIKQAAEYSRVVHSLRQFGLVRTSNLRFLCHISAPTLIWDIDRLCTDGLDGVILDLDTVASTLAGASQVSSKHLGQPALLEMLTKTAAACEVNGITLYLVSTTEPPQEIVSQLHTLPVHQWITTGDWYAQTLESFR